jgi:hypothetical protein
VTITKHITGLHTRCNPCLRSMQMRVGRLPRVTDSEWATPDSSIRHAACNVTSVQTTIHATGSYASDVRMRHCLASVWPPAGWHVLSSSADSLPWRWRWCFSETVLHIRTTRRKPKARGPPPVGCPWLLIQEIYFSVMDYWPPLWSSGQSSWLQIRRPGFDSRHYQKKK